MDNDTLYRIGLLCDGRRSVYFEWNEAFAADIIRECNARGYDYLGVCFLPTKNMRFTKRKVEE